MRRLWEDAHPEYHGPTVDFAGVDAHPRPVQRPLPVVVGGASLPALRRAVERGHGWYGFGLSPEETERCLDRLADAAGRFDRPDHLGRLEITVTPPIHAEDVDAYHRLGVDRLVLVPSHRLTDDELEEWLETHAPADRPAR